MKRSLKEARETRQLLLDTALELFSRDGYANVSVQQIAAAASLTKGAVYHHFHDKADLFLELVKQTTEELECTIAQALQPGGLSLEQQLTEALTRILQLLEQSPRYRLCVGLILHGPVNLQGLERVQAYLTAHRVQQRALLIGLFEPAARAGKLRSGVTPEVAAEAILAYQHGLHRQWLLHASFSLQSELVPLVDVLVAGLFRES